MLTKKQQRRDEELKNCMKAMRSFLNAFRGMLEDDLRVDGLSLAQMRMLYAVKEKSGVAAAELARTCEISPQSMQALLERAEREKWIRRSKSSENNRIVTTELTPRGAALLQKGQAYAARAGEIMWGTTKSSKIREIQELLQQGMLRAEIKRAKKVSE